MRKLIAFAAMAYIATAVSAYARTPQQELYSHLVQQAAKSWECPMVPKSVQECNPKPVTGSSQAAAAALQKMRIVERLGVLCAARDSNACLRQDAARQSVGKMGWCARPTMGFNNENVIVWARCAKTVIYKAD